MIDDKEVRTRIRIDLTRARELNIEAKALRARLDQNAQARSTLSMAMIAIRHCVPLSLVHSIAKAMTWTSDEKPPRGMLPVYDAHHAS